MLTAQEMQDREIVKIVARMEKMTEEEREQKLQMLKGFLKENEENSSGRTSSSRKDSDSFDLKNPRDLVELVMARHGFTREKAMEQIEAFGG